MKIRTPKLREFRLVAGFLAAAAILGALGACGDPADRAEKYIERGKNFFEAGDYTRARLEFRNALQIDPNRVEPLYYLGAIYDANGDLKNAYNKFVLVVDKDPKHIRALIKLGHYLLLGNQPDGAMEKATAVLELENDNAEANALRSAIFLRRGELTLAENASKAALAKDPGNVRAASVLAGLRREQGQITDALAILDRTIELNPGERALRLIMINLHAERGEYAQVEQLYGELIGISPANRRLRNDLSRLLLKQGRIDDAEALFRDATEKLPGNTQTKLSLIGFLTDHRGFRAAKRELLAFIKAEPANYDLVFHLASLYSKNKAEDDAKNVYVAIIEDSDVAPAGLKARYLLAQHFVRRDDPERAIQLIEEILEEDPLNIAVLIFRGRHRLVQGAYQDAIVDFRSVLYGEPESTEALGLLAQAQIHLGQIDLAIANLQALLELDPLNGSARRKFTQLLAERQNFDAELNSLDDIADSLPRLRSTAEILIARRSWTSAEAVARRIIDHPDGQVLGHRILGDVYHAAMRYAEALREYHKVLDLDPNSPGILRALFRTYKSNNEVEKAVEFFENLITEQPDGAVGYNLLGELYLEQKMAPEVVERAFRSALRLQPTWAVPHLNLGRSFMISGQQERAINVFQAGLQQVPGHLGLRFALAKAYQDGQDYNAAIDVYESMLNDGTGGLTAANDLASLIADFRYDDRSRLDRALRSVESFGPTSHPAFLDTIGWLHYRLRNIDEALRYLERAARGLPDNPQIRYHLGMTYYEGGQIERAMEELGAAISGAANYLGIESARAAFAKLSQ